MTIENKNQSRVNGLIALLKQALEKEFQDSKRGWANAQITTTEIKKAVNQAREAHKEQITKEVQ